MHECATYIQSGNVIFRSTGGAPRIADVNAATIEKRFGFRIPVILRTAEQLRKTIQDNPFLAAGGMRSRSTSTSWPLLRTPRDAGLDPKRSAPDAFHVRGHEIYLHLPNGMGRSKLTNAYFDSKLSTICTARNWATVLKLSEMME